MGRPGVGRRVRLLFRDQGRGFFDKQRLYEQMSQRLGFSFVLELEERAEQPNPNPLGLQTI